MTSPDYFLDIEDKLTFMNIVVGSVRQFKIAGVARDFHIVPISVPGYDRIVIESPQFFSTGFVNPAKQHGTCRGQFTLVLGEASIGDFLHSLSRMLQLALYQRLRVRLGELRQEEERNHRCLPPNYQKILDNGSDDVSLQWADFFADRDIEYIRTDPKAVLITKPEDEQVGPCLTRLDKIANDLPKQGRYKVRLHLRFLLLHPKSTKGTIAPSFQIDQLMYTSPEVSQIARTVVMNVGDFFGESLPPKTSSSSPVEPVQTASTTLTVSPGFSQFEQLVNFERMAAYFEQQLEEEDKAGPIRIPPKRPAKKRKEGIDHLVVKDTIKS